MNTKALLRPNLSIAILRMAVALIFIAHACARIYLNSFSQFGDFLESKGFPAGYYLAWAITLFELIGGIAMFFRRFVRLFCIGEIIILLIGIVLVHWQHGWFVVGMNLGGIEYSVILIIILFSIAVAESKAPDAVSSTRESGQ